MRLREIDLDGPTHYRMIAAIVNHNLKAGQATIESGRALLYETIPANLI